MFKKLKSILVLGLALVLLVLVFFVFYVPGGSVEGRVNGLSQIFNRKEVADIKFELLDYLSDYSAEERKEIFNKIPFALVKENPELLIAVFDESYPQWKELNSFNSNYLMTEVELLEKRDASPIKNTEPVTLKVTYKDLGVLGSDMKSIFMKVWSIDDRSVFVVDGSLKCEMSLTKAENKLLSFEAELFDIKTGYVFKAEYRGDSLVIRPESRKIEDTGAFELSEKIAVYDVKRLKDYVSRHFKLGFDESRLSFDDSYIDKKVSRDKEDVSALSDDLHLDLILYSDMIKLLDLEKDKNVGYAGSMRFRPPGSPTRPKTSDDGEEGESQTHSLGVGLQKEISLNIFKADW